MSTPLHWKKSSHSNPTDCVELAWHAEGAAVRDSKNPTGPTLRLRLTSLTGLINTLKAGPVSA